MTDTSIRTPRNASGFMRTIAGIVLVTFTSVTLSPSVQAMQQYATQLQAQRQIAADDSENVGSQLAKAKDQLRLLAGKPLPVTGERPTPEQRRAAKDALRAWRADYRMLRQRVQEEFDATGQLLGARCVFRACIGLLFDSITGDRREAVAALRRSQG